ncbi:MAG: glycerol-3-phosphate dehydrogenase, partial [Clostridia bacterium]|nr:glycerol-3-phosphate dehydrogenase [Clostridia bacterium]
GEALGGNRATFSGLSGIGDLVVTCTSEHSRNNAFGKLIGKGISVEEAKRAIGTVEGYFATEAAQMLADKYDVEMPIVNECYAILYEHKSAKESLINLMNRDKKQENY